ncbi:MAG: periplasmic protein [Herminiimonas sp.]|nr:periplasmic protein [Herminiimonas sp.]
MMLRICAALLALACHLSCFAQADKLASLKLVAFDGGWNLPIWAAQRQGFFEANKLNVDLSFTPNSVNLVTGLLAGKYDLAFAGIDNVIAYQEGQGEVPVEQPDLFAFMGGDNGLLSVVAAPAIKTPADLKGKTLSVDAMTTGFAFVLRDYVASKGLAQDEVKFVRAGGTGNRFTALMQGKNDGTLLRTPFDLIARDRGFNVLAEGDALGKYQGTVGVATRRWASRNEEVLINFIRAYRSGVEWIFDPKNRAVAEALLVANIRDMTPELAKSALSQLLSNGLQRDPAFNVDGIKTVLVLRSKYGQPQKQLSDPYKYIDSRFYERAFGK